MKRKAKEIALLTIPVIALAFVVPGARWLADWREQKTPTKIRIDSCELQSPTAWEAFQGAETMLVTRIVVPRKLSDGYSGKSVWEISNSSGQSWNSFESGLAEISVGSDKSSGSGDANAAVDTRRTGLLWKKIVGSGSIANVRVTYEALEFRANEEDKVVQSATRDFTFDCPMTHPPLSSLRASNFRINKVALETAIKVIKRENILLLSVQPLNTPPNTPLSDAGSKGWKIQSKKSGTTNDISINQVHYPATDSQGNSTIKLYLSGKLLAHRGKAAFMSGLLSVDGGWPQQIRVELPHGLPAKTGTINLPFTAKLAPLPK